ncbi:stage II sporulation protein M [Pontibacter sp. G13]|uniref:stage II sporulation protein M n=1 Tax=Pontibacter sp. G13 TaxID=3074898 RepID=UPI0028895198|nr:stage II sporulation protein M [Pontibacter sp. G13]WNJ21371.1 stage II sporulation protein M [Pontibacter sp. G13]
MREPAFLKKNRNKWQEYEHLLFENGNSSADPDRIAELYVQLTDDLAYARTFYPKSPTVRYLNGLAARTHLEIYQNKQTERKKFGTFWTHELPLIFASSRKYLFYAFLIFTASFIIGMIGAYTDEAFIRAILGDDYVDMTLENIRNGNPTAVYQDDSKLIMFLEIALNNIRVSFLAFAWGITLSIGTIYLLFSNGVMVGAFIGLFQRGSALSEALPIIYIHGTLELSAIVIAGAAGFMLGNSILFPGTYKRVERLKQEARKGMKMLVGLIPVFILAAALESYVTRLADMHILGKLGIILASLTFVLGYYLVYPYLLEQRMNAPMPDLNTDGHE